MNKTGVIQTGGKQYLIKENETLVVDYLQGKEKERIKFSQVLLLDDGKTLQIGLPYLEKALVQAEIIKQDKGEKIRVARFKAKSKYRKTRGHREQLTQVKIIKIN